MSSGDLIEAAKEPKSGWRYLLGLVFAGGAAMCSDLVSWMALAAPFPASALYVVGYVGVFVVLGILCRRYLLKSANHAAGVAGLGWIIVHVGIYLLVFPGPASTDEGGGGPAFVGMMVLAGSMVCGVFFALPMSMLVIQVFRTWALGRKIPLYSTGKPKD